MVGGRSDAFESTLLRSTGSLIMASSSSETSVDVNSSIEKPGPPVSSSVVVVEKRGYLNMLRLAASSKVTKEVADRRG